MINSKLNGESKNIIQDNVSKLKEIFPEIVTEDKIDFDKLKLILGKNVDDDSEKYSFTWPGKNQSIKESQKTSSGTLRPCKEESKNWDSTENLYIEGDNLEVLKLLQKSYNNKIKMIYIDPPYNTGNDLIYQNDYSDNLRNYLEFTGQIDGERESIGSKLSTNTETGGRFHSNWLNMMYPLLKLGKNLLKKNGLFFIAIDEYEYSRLKLICDEIFGEINFIGSVVTKCNPQGRGKKNLDPVHEYHLIYAKNIEEINELKLKKKSDVKEYQTFMRSGTNSRKFERPNRFYPMLVKNNSVSVITNDEYEKIYDGNFNENHIQFLKDKYSKLGFKVIFPIAKNGEEKVWQRVYERAAKECSSYIYDNNTIKTPKSKYITPTSLWLNKEYSNVSYGTNFLKQLFDNKKTFDYPKSFITVKDLISLASEGIILDFFSGSGTTAHSVMKLNNDENLNNNFILIQLPVLCNEKSDAYNEGYKNICEIGKERIRRAGDKILEKSNNKDLDIGFKVFKLDSSNLEKWDPDYSNLEQTLLTNEENIKSNRAELDLIYEIMLKYGIDLTLPIEKLDNIYSIGYGALLVCLDDNITKEVTNNIIKLKSDDVIRVVFKESGFKSDEDKTNIKETLRINNIDEFITI